MTYTYRCIGKGTTDSNGVAHITHDCSGNALSDDGYKGVGAGLMDFIASTDAPADISDGSFQSETYSILDNIIYFDGSSVTSNFTTNASITTSVDNGYVKMTPSATNKWQLLNVNSSSSYLSPSTNYRVEFDYILPSSEYCLFSICGGNVRLNWGTVGENHSAKIEQIDGTVKIYIDGSTSASGTASVGSGTDCSFGLYAMEYIKVKNFKLYPI